MAGGGIVAFQEGGMPRSDAESIAYDMLAIERQMRKPDKTEEELKQLDTRRMELSARMANDPTGNLRADVYKTMDVIRAGGADRLHLNNTIQQMPIGGFTAKLINYLRDGGYKPEDKEDDAFVGPTKDMLKGMYGGGEVKSYQTGDLVEKMEEEVSSASTEIVGTDGQGNPIRRRDLSRITAEPGSNQSEYYNPRTNYTVRNIPTEKRTPAGPSDPVAGVAALLESMRDNREEISPEELERRKKIKAELEARLRREQEEREREARIVRDPETGEIIEDPRAWRDAKMAERAEVNRERSRRFEELFGGERPPIEYGPGTSPAARIYNRLVDRTETDFSDPRSAGESVRNIFSAVGDIPSEMGREIAESDLGQFTAGLFNMGQGEEETEVPVQDAVDRLEETQTSSDETPEAIFAAQDKVAQDYRAAMVEAENVARQAEQIEDPEKKQNFIMRGLSAIGSIFDLPDEKFDQLMAWGTGAASGTSIAESLRLAGQNAGATRLRQQARRDALEKQRRAEETQKSQFEATLAADYAKMGLDRAIAEINASSRTQLTEADVIAGIADQAEQLRTAEQLSGNIRRSIATERGIDEDEVTQAQINSAILQQARDTYLGFFKVFGKTGELVQPSASEEQDPQLAADMAKYGVVE
jgi:hypothetical protein